MEVGVAAIERVNVVQLDHFLGHLLLQGLPMLLCDLERRCQLVNFHHELDQLRRAQFDNLAEDHWDLTVASVQEWLLFRASFLDRTIEHS